ncbi:DUF799 domain-containing protein [Aquabacterium sp. A7-Y]|uniref:DUF799 domain-containing protein n=1 Tax=Aquabacterium sp. A7-Y TaxID=1349605 RepID=UPI00223E2C49|nr:DUF799 domain-containing protein [Aquabacterium sp. A7-Y]MCW7537480.1 DUF799 domain-containing protein [Aquabacterium sp. A7-Y]
MKPTPLSLCAALLGAALLGGCATQPPYDYSAFMKAKPATLLVMPPVNGSPDVKASPSVWSHATQPLSEAGYYVLPVTLVDETFRQNGVTTPNDAQDIPYPKLRDFFGADAAVYLKVNQYGTSYAVLSSETRVEVEGRIIDLRSGELLWQGKAFATSAEQQQQSQGGLVGLLVTAVVKQIIGTVTDEAYKYAGIANQRMLGAPRYNGVLPGPRSPYYGQPPVTK